MTGPARASQPPPADAAASALDAHADYRVLRRMRPMIRREAYGVRPDMLIGCALDVETTGLDHGRDAIIELALQRFWADRNGRIVVTGRPYSWLEDPGAPIDAAVSRLTGLDDAAVAGRSIMDPVAASLIADAHFVVAHNAGFDRPFVERRLPDARGRPWVCSMRDVPWADHGFEGRSLSHLLLQMGLFYDAHRAATDVTALLHLLDHPMEAGRTVLRAAVDTASRPTWMLEAVAAPYRSKDALRLRGYRWDAVSKLWKREVAMADLDAEVEWALMRVYGGRAKPRVRQVTWSERHLG